MDLIEKPREEEKKSPEAGEQDGAGFGGRANIKNILAEEVDTEDVEENKEVNPEHFQVASFDIPEDKTENKDGGGAGPVPPDPEKKEEVKTEAKEEKKPVITEQGAQDKQGAVVRLMKPEVMMSFANILLGRLGAIWKPNNPDFLKFDGADRKDLSIILGESIKEGNWGGIGAKWLLIGLVTIIIAGKIWNRNKPAAGEVEGEQKQEISSSTKESPAGLDKILAKFEEMQRQTQDHITELRQQNEFLKGLLDKKVERGREEASAGSQDKDPRYYKGIDLETVQFTDKGSRIYPDKAGQKGYGKEGAKMGTPSQEDKELYFAWKRYKDFILEDAA